MYDMFVYFSRIIEYIEKILKNNDLYSQYEALTIIMEEERQYLLDFTKKLEKYDNDPIELNEYEAFIGKKTDHKIFSIHLFLYEFEWHTLGIDDLNGRILELLEIKINS